MESNRNGIGARIEIYGEFGQQIRDVRSGDGFRFMNSLNPHFGIGTLEAITQVVIKWPSGLVDTIENPTINQPLFVIEGATLSNDIAENKNFKIYPNPAQNMISISSDIEFVKFKIFDLNGKVVLQSNNANNQISIQTLSSGLYILQLEDENEKKYSHQLIKQ